MHSAKTKILIIDDEPIIRSLLLDLLAHNCYDVVAVANGLEGITKANKINFDIILSDIHMPKMNGLETMRKIKQINPQSVFVIMSSYSDKDCELATKEGAIAHLQKPFNIADVLKVVENIAHPFPGG